MTAWFVVNICLSLLALVFNVINKDAPHRPRFLICFIALCSWLIPWALLGALLPASPALTLAETPLVLSSTDWSAEPSITVGAVWSAVSIALVCASVIGAFLFAFSLRRYRALLQRLESTACPGDFLWERADNEGLGRGGSNPHIRIQSEIPGAFTTGFLQPTIWIHSGLVGTPNLPAVLLHEAHHVQHRDNLYLWIITLIERLLWWNPLVQFLGKRARELQELACDEACAKVHPGYRRMLNQLILALSKSEHSVVRSPVPGIFHDGNFNVRRIRALERRFHMKAKHYLNSIVLLACSVLAVNWGSAQQPIDIIAGSEDSQSYLVPFSIIQDGQLIAAPTVLVQPGKPFSIKAGGIDFELNGLLSQPDADHILLEITVKIASREISPAFMLYPNQEGKWSEGGPDGSLEVVVAAHPVDSESVDE